MNGVEKTASTSRVLNLCAVARTNSEQPEYTEQPFFRSGVLNSAIIIKHRLRKDEQAANYGLKSNATKVIIPFARSDLSLGGRSFFVGQRGWLSMLADYTGGETDDVYDIAVLEALDELPSLDPFLLREHLKRRGFNIGACYFAIAPADVERMERFVAAEISRLVDMAYGAEGGGSGGGNISKLVSLLLSGQTGSQLEPLRMTLGLQVDNFREGVFSWRGFLYYKWAISQLWPEVRVVMTELERVKIVGARDVELAMQVQTQGANLQKAIMRQVRSVRATLQIYDDAYNQLTQARDPSAFRDFLLKSPEMFISLGERAGTISHIASFWRFRFPKGRPLRAELSELLEILQDFLGSIFDEEQDAAGSSSVW